MINGDVLIHNSNIKTIYINRICEKMRRQTAYKPGSVLKGGGAIPSCLLSRTIHLGPTLPWASRDLPGNLAWKDAVAVLGPVSLCGLAPGGVCLAACVAACAVRSYRTFSPLPAELRACGSRQRGRFILCGTFPRISPAGRYPAPSFHGARTFLSPVFGQESCSQ